MLAGRCSKTVVFVAILALTTFGALVTASAPTIEALQRAQKGDKGDRGGGVKYAIATRNFPSVPSGGAVTLWPRSAPGWERTAEIALRHVANLAVAAHNRIEPAPPLAYEALEIAQWASQSSAAAAIHASFPFARFAFRQTIAAIDSARFLHGDGFWQTYDAFRPTYNAGPVLDRRGKGDYNAAHAALVDPKPLTADEVQMLLGADETLVFFLSGDNESYVFALTREGFEWQTISLGEKNMAAKVADFRRGLDVDGLTKSVSMGKPQLFDLAVAQELYGALFGPVEALIKDKAQLLIVPSGPLTALPFHLLVTDKPVNAVPQMQTNDMAAYRDAAWLVKRHAVTVVPSIASLKALRVFARKSQGTMPMIGFGDPVFAPDQAAAPAQRTSTVKIARTRAYSNYWHGASVKRAKLAEALAPLPDSAEELKTVAAKLGASFSDIHLGRPT